MSLGMAVLTSVGCLLLGGSGGMAAFHLRKEVTYQQGLLDGQHQERLAHGTWSPAINPTAWNLPVVPVGRHRSPNGQVRVDPTEPQPKRPVFYDR